MRTPASRMLAPPKFCLSFSEQYHTLQNTTPNQLSVPASLKLSASGITSMSCPPPPFPGSKGPCTILIEAMPPPPPPGPRFRRRCRGRCSTLRCTAHVTARTSSPCGRPPHLGTEFAAIYRAKWCHVVAFLPPANSPTPPPVASGARAAPPLNLGRSRVRTESGAIQSSVYCYLIYIHMS